MSKYEGIYTLLFGIFIRESSFWYLNPFQLIHPKQGSIARKKNTWYFSLVDAPSCTIMLSHQEIGQCHMALARWLTRITPDNLLGFGKFSSYIYFLDKKWFWSFRDIEEHTNRPGLICLRHDHHQLYSPIDGSQHKTCLYGKSVLQMLFIISLKSVKQRAAAFHTLNANILLLAPCR